MLEIRVKIVEPDPDTLYLVGPEGLVWTQPSIGEPYIVAARNEQEQQAAAGFVGELLQQGLVPYGLPLNQRVVVATFGGSPIRDCRWVPHADAPLPTGEPADDLPTRAAVVVVHKAQIQTQAGFVEVETEGDTDALAVARDVERIAEDVRRSGDWLVPKPDPGASDRG